MHFISHTRICSRNMTHVMAAMQTWRWFTWTLLEMTPREYCHFLLLGTLHGATNHNFQTHVSGTSASPESDQVYISETALAWARVRKAVAEFGLGEDFCN